MGYKYLILGMIMQLACLPVFSQSSSWVYGYQLSQLQADFGQGVQIVSPSFLKDAVILKLNASQRFLDYNYEGRNKWSDFYTFSAGLANRPAMISDKIGLYGGGGVMMILPNKEFSSVKQEWAGYGLFGFNFYFDPGFSYFIEAGSVGSGARAEESDNERIYANGFFFQVGFKIHFVSMKE